MPEPNHRDDSDRTLADVRAELRDRAQEGVECPCCRQFVKVYRRQIYATIARDLIAVYRHAGVTWCKLSDVPGIAKRATGGGDFAKARYWYLVEQQPGEREDGSNRVGVWRVTPYGERFVRRQLAVPKYSHVYNGVCRWQSGEWVTIDEALGKRFSYDELMTS